MSDYRKQFDALSAAIKDHVRRSSRYLSDAHSNYQNSKDTHGHLTTTSAHYLFANNLYARAAVAKLVFREIEGLVRASGAPNFMQITLTPRMGAVSEGRADRFNPLPMKRIIGKYFKNVNMIGVIEPGFYPRVPFGTGRGLICFHAHLFGWGQSPVAVKSMAKPFKLHYPSIFTNRPSAYVQTVPRADVPKLLKYHWKVPDIGYQLAVHTLEEIDEKTGELIPWLDPLSKSKKYSLRAGERVRVDNALRYLTFDELLVATGDEGKALKGRIVDEARAPYRLRQKK